MVSLAIAKALQIYGIAIVISMIVAVLIKVLVAITGSVKKPAAAAQTPQQASAKPAPVQTGVPAEVVAAISGALATALGPHRVLHIAESGRAWAHTGRSAQHSHQPRS